MNVRIRQVAVVLLLVVHFVGAIGNEFAFAESFSPNDFRLEFSELGELRANSEATLSTILARVPTRSDIFLFSHGWLNDPRTAENRYQSFINGMATRFPRGRLADESFRPLLIGIYWPSAWFPVNNCFATQPDAASIATWATTGFPSAAAVPDGAFQRELSLITRSLTGLTPWDRYRQLPEIIARWNGGLEPGEPEITSEPSIVNSPPSRLAEVFDQSIASNVALAQAGALRALSPCSMLNVLSFWAMKKRAGEVGARGVHAALQQILAAAAGASEPIRIHLIGHSFGSKVVTAAVTGPLGSTMAAQRPVDSLILIQGAFSHFGFASTDALRNFGVESSTPGRYRDIVDRNLVRSAVVAFYSEQDVANTVFYPIGAALAHDFLAKPLVAADSLIRDCEQPGEGRKDVGAAARNLRTEIPKYGAVGANGIQGVADAQCLALLRNRPLPRFNRLSGGVVNADASDVITGHSEITYPEVFDLIWELVLATRGTSDTR